MNTPYFALKNSNISAFCRYITVFFFLATSCSLARQNDGWRLIPCDTIILPNNIGYTKSYYSAEHSTQVNTYISFPDGQNPPYFHHFCMDSIITTSIFPIYTLLSNYMPENQHNLIIQRPGAKPYFRIDRNGDVMDTLHFFAGEAYQDFWSFMFFYPVVSNNGKFFFYSYISIPNTNDYQENRKSRLYEFGNRYLSKLSIIGDSILITDYRKWVYFPKIYTKEGVSFESYWPKIAVNKKMEFISVFPYVDSLYVTGQDGQQRRYPLYSRHHTNPYNEFNVERYLDYLYLDQYACHEFKFSNVLYDSYRDYIYLTAALPIKFENEDGTKANAADKPWSLIILDSTYAQIGEIDMPDYLSKHSLMVTPQGLAVQKRDLSDKGEAIFIIYKIEKS
ncbi:MAG: DUF4221 domain-containing protein [Bacteroidales bacterium]|jgi:hypothetical protein|nr:DUF4221 domain-containing protein [Bacteroidales bacterium]